MTPESDSNRLADRDARAGRSQRRQRLAAKAREAAMRLSRPSPLPPHPEGLAPSLWPVLAATVAVALSIWNWTLAFIAVGLVLAYAIATRNDRKRHLLYAYVQGHRQFKAGDYEAALANFVDMEESDFAPPAVLRAIGLTNYKLGRWAEAATYLEDVPNRSEGETVALAHALVELEEAEVAATILDTLPALTEDAVVVRSVVDFRLDRFRQAADRLGTLLAAAPDGQPALEEPFLAARYWLGVALRSCGDMTRANEVLSGLYEIDPGYHDVAGLLGRPRPPAGTEGEGPEG